MTTVKLPKGVKVYGFSGKAWRGEIPVTDCPDFIADKFADIQKPVNGPANKSATSKPEKAVEAD